MFDGEDHSDAKDRRRIGTMTLNSILNFDPKDHIYAIKSNAFR